jgi:hypothetical protein
MNRIALITTLALTVFGGSANAAKIKMPNGEVRHTWYELKYPLGECDHAPGSPQEMYKASLSWQGFVVEVIAPENVTKDDTGAIHVRVDGKQKGETVHWDFFTTRSACEKFISDNGIKPTQAPESDIN